MGILEEARAAQDGKARKGCGVGRLLPTLDEKDAAELLEALADEGIDAATLASVLRDRGYTHISQQMVQRHRNKACCGQSR